MAFPRYSNHPNGIRGWLKISKLFSLTWKTVRSVDPLSACICSLANLSSQKGRGLDDVVGHVEL